MEKPYYQSIVDTLKSVKRPGVYAAGGEATMPIPAISLIGEANTMLGLPLCEAQAKHLIEIASRAPFGRGEETIVDTSVRCTWQLSPTQFSITSPQWKKSLQLLLAKVKTELGCDAKMKVTCQLYKLLLYEPGGFFKVVISNYYIVSLFHSCRFVVTYHKIYVAIWFVVFVSVWSLSTFYH